jgi:hypothetical protein
MAKKGCSQFQCALVLATALALSLPGSAQALVTAGVSRSPSASYVAAYSDTPGGVTVSVERAGSLIGTQEDPVEAVLEVAAQAGDVITVEFAGQQVLQTTFDGLPAFDASLCGVTSAFSGRWSGSVISVSASDPNAYRVPGLSAAGTVTSSAGGAFAGTFAVPVQPSWEALVTTSQTIGSVRWLSGYSRFVGTCPQAASGGGGSAPSLVLTPKDITPPTGHMTGRVLAGGLRALLAGRATTTVVVGEAGVTIDQGVYLDNGAKLPAHIAAAKRATLVARAHAVSKHAGKVTLRLRPTARARVLRGRARARLAIVTTLRDKAGNIRRLPVRRVTLRRR